MNSSKTLRDKDPLFDVVNPHSFTHRFNALLLHSGFRTRTDARDNPIVLFLELGGHVAANGLDSVYYQVADFGQLERLIGFVHEIGCPELAIHLKRGRDIYYQGRTDLVTLDAAYAAGLDGNHLSRRDDLEIAKLGDRMLGPDGLLAASDEPFMAWIKAHPELVEGLLDKRTRQKLRPRLKSRKALLVIDDPERLQEQVLENLSWGHDFGLIDLYHPIYVWRSLGGISEHGIERYFTLFVDYQQLTHAIRLLRKLGCRRFAEVLAHARKVFYRGRTDLVDFATRNAAGLNGAHLTATERAELAAVEQLVLGPGGLGDKLDEAWMKYFKSHPEVLEGVAD